MGFKIQLDGGDGQPLYRQLYSQIANLIRSGQLAYQERLPSTRELAIQLGLNRTTVAAAYALLEKEGLIAGHVGRGSFVVFAPPADADRSGAQFSFASSRPLESDFPLDQFRQSCREVVDSAEAAAILQLGSPAGYPALREYLLEQARREGLADAGDDLLITSGCQQAIDLIARTFLDPGRTAIIEDPTYHGARNALRRAGASLTGIPFLREGLDLDRLLEAVTQPGSLIVLTPNFQNPTGHTLSLAARRALVERAASTGALLVENDIYGALRYSGEALPALKSYPGAPVLLVRSFSKIAFPGLRVGWILGHRRWIAQLVETKQWADLHSDQLSQAIFLRFAESGRLQHHLSCVVAAGASRLKAALEACENFLPENSHFTRPQGGMNLWVTLPKNIHTAALQAEARRAGVDYTPGEQFSVELPHTNSLRLSFGRLTPAAIEEGVRRLGSVFAQHLAGASPRLEAAPALV
jgi:DNA-binding transcriptional MocR family regulator